MKNWIHPFIKREPFLPSPDSGISSGVQIGLGTEYKLDFLIRKPNGIYVLVEIENPWY